MDLIVLTSKQVAWDNRKFDCAIGRAGHTTDKQEGDGATPVGIFPFRRLLYRPDRLTLPGTQLPRISISPTDGWCDAPGDPNYNRPVSLPYPASCERLWRDDGLYDLIVILGHNDDPPVSGLGSAIFLHIAGPGYPPTDGCVALSREDLAIVVAGADTTSQLIVNNFAA